MTTVSGISRGAQHASILAAKKAAVVPIKYAQGLQAERDKTAKTVIAPDAIDETRPNPDLTKTFEADDTFANTEAAKARGGRLDLLV
jgi:predicted acylesterase/phospholipase RssA